MEEDLCRNAGRDNPALLLRIKERFTNNGDSGKKDSA